MHAIMTETSSLFLSRLCINKYYVEKQTRTISILEDVYIYFQQLVVGVDFFFFNCSIGRKELKSGRLASH